MTVPPFAQSGSGDFPMGTAIGLIAFFGSVALVSLAGLFASRDRLATMAETIGTKNPLVARVVCAVCLLIGLFGVAAGVMGLLGKL